MLEQPGRLSSRYVNGDDLDCINQRRRHTSCWQHHSVGWVPGERELSAGTHFPLPLTGHNVTSYFRLLLPAFSALMDCTLTCELNSALSPLSRSCQDVLSQPQKGNRDPYCE